MKQQKPRTPLPPAPKPQAGWKEALLQAAVTKPEPDKKPDNYRPNYPKSPWHHRTLHALTILVAIGLAGISAYFSVTGMARIFPGALLAITVMAALMESGKLAGIGWLSRNWRVTRLPLRYTLSGLIAILAIINAAGVYGQLSAAHLDPHAQATGIINVQSAESQARIDAKATQIADYTHRIAQIDTVIDEIARRGRSSTFVEMTNSQRTNRAELVAERTTAQNELVLLRAGQARIAGEQKRADADIGVLEYGAQLMGVDRETAIRWLILAMTLCCDPMAMCLIAATARKPA